MERGIGCPAGRRLGARLHPTAGTTATTASTSAPPRCARPDGSGEDPADDRRQVFPSSRPAEPARPAGRPAALPRAFPHRARLGAVPPRRARRGRPASRAGPVVGDDGELAPAAPGPAVHGRLPVAGSGGALPGDGQGPALLSAR